MLQPRLILLVLGLLISGPAYGYPQFIGYKYASCITCHVNGHGNGPLSDYGRALWAAEIAGRAFAGSRTDEQLGESAGFLGKTELPWWIRPGIKARQLQMIENPPKGNSRSILMQAEANVALFFDPDQKYAAVASFGYVPVPVRLKDSPEDTDEWISREHYIRVQATPELWVYAGMMDKVYGIRLVDHTAVSRQYTGIAQNDQSHGIVLHYIKPTWELSFNAFAGNLYQDEDLRQQGASALFEYEVKEAWRLGLTALSSTNKYVKNQRYGVLSRYGFGFGSALLAEVGLIENTPKSQEAETGYYVFTEATQKLVRGYHAFVGAQVYRDSIKGSRPENITTSLGLLAFPMQRVELRIELQNGRQMTSDAQVARDAWTLLGQLHLSL